MPRGEHPNSRNNLKRGRPFDAESARKAKQKSDESKLFYKTLTEDLKERCSPDRLAKMNERIISMAEHGNLRAYELVRDGLGENPRDRNADPETLAKLDAVLAEIKGVE